MTEEDRLAFLRAQAAQDAALAKYHGSAGGPNAIAPGRAGVGKPGDRSRDQDRDRGRKRRGRRGGRFRRDNRKPFGPAQNFGQTDQEGSGGGVNSPATGNDTGGSSTPAEDTNGGSGGGGEHSQPPV